MADNDWVPKRGKEPESFATVDELVDFLAEKSAAHRANCRAMMGCVGGIAVVTVLAAVASWVVKGRFPVDFLTSVISTFACFGAAAAISTGHRRALKIAADNADPRLTAYLLEATAYAESDVVQIAYSSLIDRLPAVTPADYHAWTPEQRGALLRSLAASNDPAYLTEALRAIRRCAGPEAIARLDEIPRKSAPKAKQEQWGQVQNLARMASAEVRMRSAREIVDRELAASTARLGAAPSGPQLGPGASHQHDV